MMHKESITLIVNLNLKLQCWNHVYVIIVFIVVKGSMEIIGVENEAAARQKDTKTSRLRI